MAPGRKKVILTSTLTSTGVIIGGNQWKPWTRNPHKMGTLVICGRISVEFRFLCREACRFKSCHPHQNPGTKVPGFFADGDLESWDSRSPLPLRSVPGRRPPDVWHPVIRIISFKPFVYKGLELFLILDLSLEQSGK